MTDRFDLEAAILQCWSITNDITMMEEQGANIADMTNLACVYEYKFKQLWSIFETMVAEGQFVAQAPASQYNSIEEYFGVEK